MDRVLDGPLGKELLKDLEVAGFKGLKIRVMEFELHKELWRILGANPTPMGWPIYPELQQGTIDAQENPLWVIWTYKMYEVQKYLTLTGHVYSAHIDVANLNWFNSLPKNEQSLLQQSMIEAAHYERQWNRTNEAGFLAKLKKAGMIVDEHPDIASFKAKAIKLKDLPMFQKKRTKELLEKFLEATKQ